MRRPQYATLALSAAAFGWYAVFSLERRREHYTGLDLAIFEQAVARLARFQAPIATIKGAGFNLFGDHFHPIIVLAVPFHWIYPRAASLLVAQALATAISVWVVTRFAQRQLGSTPGFAVGLAYALGWALASALAFDFHEVMFGVPVMAVAVTAIHERRWSTAYAASVLLLFVKEDMAATVLAIGVVVYLKGRRAGGVALVGAAVAWGAVTLLVVIPALSPTGRYMYLSGDTPRSPINPEPTGLDLTQFVLGSPRWQTLLLLLLPVLFAALLSPIALIAVPTLAWRFFSVNDAYWGTRLHYNAIVWPVLFVAGVDGLLRLARWRRLPREATPWFASAAMLAVAVSLLPFFAFWPATRASFWQECARCGAARRAVASIPDNVSVAADPLLMPELVDRTTLYLLAPDLKDPLGRAVPAQYVLLDETHRDLWPAPNWVSELRARLAARGFALVYTEGGYDVFRAA